ncbi:UDP-glucuronosyltransferase 2B20 [Orchesella cincta]|uniref:UDP-glucuronosyltransferase 2B20 n=1 Tax=Orchesella cincta TaxID=48709 RepID=A0A1D2MYE5_ORCCI|nr:UDP-glucuronosyltransferase 2B20 [Orchesella cincta]
MKMFRMTIKIVAVFLLSSISISESANILFLTPIATKSHLNIFNSLINGLAERDHNITVVAPLKMKTPLPNVREISPIPFEIMKTAVSSGNPFERRKEGKSGLFLSWNSTFMEVGSDMMYRNEEIKELIKGGPGSFDLIIVNAFMNHFTLGIVHELQAPHMYVITMPAMNVQVSKFGLYFPPSFVPCSFAAFSDRMNFKERILNFLAEYFMLAITGTVWVPYLSKMYQDHLGSHVPNADEIDRNVSLLLMNTHFSLTYPRPLLPDVVEVGGLHTRESKPLPTDLDEFLSGAKDGFILFSLGSIVQPKDMPVETSTKFLNVFSKLKQRVIWKWDGELPGKIPSNVKLAKWLPQQDILGHKNIKIFITHGGLLSTQEAVFHGVPLIGFPFFADQDLNIIQAEKAGFALSLEINEFTEEMLEDAINKVLTNDSYSKRAKHLSTVFRDRPLSPLQTAIYWVEYIIKHKGAEHLKSAGRDLNFAAYHSIDLCASGSKKELSKKKTN